MTEIEYNTATELRRDVLPFIVKDWGTAEEDPERQRKHHEFKGTVEQNHCYKTFSTKEELLREVFDALLDLQQREGWISKVPPLFVPPEEFFKPWLDQGRLFHHCHPFSGREQVLDDLDAFLKSDACVLTLYGPGGSGKSRLLLEWARRVSKRNSDVEVSFVDTALPLDGESLARLPSGRCVVIVDDAHRCDEVVLTRLLALASSRKSRLQFIWAARPHGRRLIERLLGRAGISGKSKIPIELSLARVEDVLEVVRHALPPEKRWIADRLVSPAGGNWLVLTVATELARRGRDFSGAMQDDEFRCNVLGKLADDAADACMTKFDRAKRDHLLAILAVTSPFSPTEWWIQSAAELLGVKGHEIETALRELEEGGMLLRTGRRWEVVPDLLGDYFLERVCLDSDGRFGSFAREMYGKFRAYHRRTVLRRLAEVEWLSHARDERKGDIGGLWPILEGEVARDPDKASEVIRDLANVAILWPETALSLVEKAGEHHGFSTLDTDAVTVVLGRVAWHPALTGQACDLLWELGRDDVRALSSNPGHPLRVLKEVASYIPGKPVEVHEAVLARVRLWLANPPAHSHVHSPLDVIDALLSKEADDWLFTDNAVSVRSFGVPYETTKRVRHGALDLLREVALSGDLKSVLRAMDSLIKAFESPHGGLGRVLSDEELDSWSEQDQRALLILREVIEQDRRPIVQVAAEQRLLQIRRGQKYQSEIAKMLSQLEDGLDYEVTRALWPPWDFIDYGDGEQSEQQWLERVNKTAQEWATPQRDARTAFADLNQRLAAIESTGVSAEPLAFIDRVFAHRPSMAHDWSIMALEDPETPLSRCCGWMLRHLRIADRQRFSEIVKEALGEPSCRHDATIATGYHQFRGTDGFTGDDARVVEELVARGDEAAVVTVLQPLRRLGPEWHTWVKQLALKVEPGDSQAIAEALCSVFASEEDLASAGLTEAELQGVLGKLVTLNRLNRVEDHQIFGFLNGVGKEEPVLVGKFFLERMKYALEQEGYEYHPLPWHGLGLTRVIHEQSRELVAFLREIRELALKASGRMASWLPKLYREMTGCCGLGVDLLDEWLTSNSPDRIRAAGSLLSACGSSVVFDQVDRTCRWLDHAAAVNQDGYKVLCRHLHRAADGPFGFAKLGEEPPQYVTLRDDARRARDSLMTGSPAWQFFNSLTDHAQGLIDHYKRDDYGV